MLTAVGLKAILVASESSQSPSTPLVLLAVDSMLKARLRIDDDEGDPKLPQIPSSFKERELESLPLSGLLQKECAPLHTGEGKSGLELTTGLKGTFISDDAPIATAALEAVTHHDEEQKK